MKTKIAYEKQTIERMLLVYCRLKHNRKGKSPLCENCKSLKEYAHARLTNCMFGEEKPACRKCPVHCYKPDMKKEIKEVMQYAGPRMLFFYPKDFVIHFVELFTQKKVERKQKKQSQ